MIVHMRINESDCETKKYLNEYTIQLTQVSHESMVPTRQLLFLNASLISGTFSLSHINFNAEKYGEIGRPDTDLQ